ncbi:exosortase-associated protein EpsI, B-type [Methylophilus sp. TWE2]|uniref:exosortase-associated protein EpsI, B-type n=1 Tax=Methylophilus sp. TWE2 TaxID=1662285 RepID=UPI0006715F24|nr:exosortase-associated protein EpsI, B-type [Methylophilus sp. TWE2]AKR43394.1 EpsI family protein [Methylophilus sp. TWE2]
MVLKKIILMLLMIFAAIAAINLRPTHKMASDRQGFVLEQIIPKQFGSWKEIDTGIKPIVNPHLESLIHKIYNQTLSRTYMNDKDEIVMLVIAYGEDQSDSTGLHYPEVCYPAQGFQISPWKTGDLSTSKGTVKVKRLVGTMGPRVEPITYWTTIGNKVVIGNKETKLEKLNYGLHGVIPDGLLFRTSSINTDPELAFKKQNAFINDLLAALSPNDLKSIAGL